MYRLLVIFIALALANGSPFPKEKSLENHSLDGKIVGGTQASITARPYMASLIISDGQGSYLCGGSIISPLFILTAAHCLQGNITSVTVRVGSASLNSGGQVQSTNLYKVHPSYSSQTQDYDVALVNLKSPLVFSTTIKPVRLATPLSTVPGGTNCIVSGWGTTREGGSISTTLLQVTVPIVTRTNCQKSYGPGITIRMICAGYTTGGKDSCQGDSGGPLVLQNNTQVGVVSFGYGCARANYPGVYANVAAFRDWIKLNSGI